MATLVCENSTSSYSRGSLSWTCGPDDRVVRNLEEDHDETFTASSAATNGGSSHTHGLICVGSDAVRPRSAGTDQNNQDRRWGSAGRRRRQLSSHAGRANQPDTSIVDGGRESA